MVSNTKTKQAVVARNSWNDRYYALLGNTVLALAIVGYPLFASMSEFLGYTTSSLNIGFRIFHASFCVVLLLWTIFRGTLRIDWMIGLFLALYSARMLVDLNNPLFPDIVKDSQFFAVALLAPTLAMAGGRDWYDEKLCLRLMLLIGAPAGLLVAYTISTTGVVVQEEDARAALEFLNPISIGYHGLFLGVASLMLIVRHRTANWFFVCVLGVLLGAFLLIVSGSRGPIVALMVAVTVTGAANRNANIAYIALGVLGLALIAYFGVPEVILYRFRNVGLDASSLDRIYATQLSIEIALENIFTGYAYIEPVTGLYPHNLLVESAFALGLGGFLLMLAIQVSIIFNALRSIRHGDWFLPFVAMVMLANAYISGSLWASAPYFMFAWLLRDRRSFTRVATDSASFANGVRRT